MSGHHESRSTTGSTHAAVGRSPHGVRQAAADGDGTAGIVGDRLPPGHVRLRRIYEPAAPDDGPRVLVEKLWPRGLKRTEAAIDLWLKEVAPSTELRRWFGHDPARWQEFRRQYLAELGRNAERAAPLHELARRGPVTLLFATRDVAHSGAAVLREFLLRRRGGAVAPRPAPTPAASRRLYGKGKRFE